jgi:hypothetical protein
MARAHVVRPGQVRSLPLVLLLLGAACNATGDSAAPVRTDGPANEEAGAQGDGGGPADGAPPDGAIAPEPPRVRSVVPVVLIQTMGPIPNEPKTPGRIKVIEDHAGTWKKLEDLASAPVSLDTPIGIELRGRSSQAYDKRPFSVELRDDAMTSRAHALLGMPRESDWVFTACWNDRTCLRNPLGLQLGRDLGGMWQPRYDFAELFLNGTYLGLYNVVEKVKRDKNRLNFPAPAPDLSAPENDITGTYLLRIEFSGKKLLFGTSISRDFTTRSGQVWTYNSPRPDQITAAQKAYIQGYVDDFETMMAGDDWEDPQRGFPRWIDVRSFAEYALVKELSRDIDGYRLSSYAYKRSDKDGGKLCWGPLWDFDRTFGNSINYDGVKPEGWSFEAPGRPSTTDRWQNLPPFWRRLFDSKLFMKALACRWKEARKGPIQMANINAHIERWDRLIARSAERDDATWRLANSQPDINIPRFKPYREAVADLRTWNDKRMAWMDGVLNPLCP